MQPWRRRSCIAAIETFTRASTRSPPRTRCFWMSPAARRTSARAGCCGATASSTGHNRGYDELRAYLDTFTAEKRKKARRERRRVAEAGITFDTRLGAELDARLLDRVYAFIRDTFLQHGHEPYLTRAFFTRDRAHARAMR